LRPHNYAHNHPRRPALTLLARTRNVTFSLFRFGVLRRVAGFRPMRRRLHDGRPTAGFPSLEPKQRAGRETTMPRRRALRKRKRGSRANSVSTNAGVHRFAGRRGFGQFVLRYFLSTSGLPRSGSGARRLAKQNRFASEIFSSFAKLSSPFLSRSENSRRS
jgi:hypothetical protein